jgi:predicted dehydrogenase
MADGKIKVGFIGCGSISRLYTSIYGGLADMAQVVAVADLVDDLAETRRRELSEEYTAEARRSRALAAKAETKQARDRRIRRAEDADAAAGTSIRKYHSHEELLKDDEVQVVVVLTPPSVRAEPTIAAAEAGRHIFTQGPMARSVAEADAMIAAIRKAGVKFHAQCGSRYPRDMVLARRAVESGRLGQVGSARVDLSWYRAQAYYRGWHGTWDGEGGGSLYHQGRYIVDPFLWVVGSRIVEVFAYAGPVFRELEHENLSQAVVRFASGATGTIHTSLLSHRQELTPPGRIELMGRDASLLVGETYNPSRTKGLSRDNFWKATTTFGSDDNPSAVEALEALRAEVSGFPEEATEEYQSRLFLECVANNREPIVPIETPYHHVEVTRAIYKSAEERIPVTLPLDRDDPFYTFQGRITGREPGP